MSSGVARNAQQAVEQLVRECDRLRAENEDLRQQLQRTQPGRSTQLPESSTTSGGGGQFFAVMPNRLNFVDENYFRPLGVDRVLYDRQGEVDKFADQLSRQKVVFLILYTTGRFTSGALDYDLLEKLNRIMSPSAEIVLVPLYYQNSKVSIPSGSTFLAEDQRVYALVRVEISPKKGDLITEGRGSEGLLKLNSIKKDFGY